MATKHRLNLMKVLFDRHHVAGCIRHCKDRNLASLLRRSGRVGVRAIIVIVPHGHARYREQLFQVHSSSMGLHKVSTMCSKHIHHLYFSASLDRFTKDGCSMELSPLTNGAENVSTAEVNAMVAIPQDQQPRGCQDIFA
jgi:hypothetical protein